MLITLIRKEIVSHVLSLRFGVTFILTLLLVFASVYICADQYERDRDQEAAITKAGKTHIADILSEEKPQDQQARLLWREGRLDAVPSTPLSTFARGLTDSSPAAIKTRTWKFTNIDRHADRNAMSGLFSTPDLVYIVSIVLSLLAILFSFDSICGEKETGTLRLMMSNSVPRDLVLLAKWIGGYLVLITPFTVAFAGGVGYAWWKGIIGLDGDVLTRMSVMFGVACLYLSVFFTLGLLVSCVTHKSATSLFVCLFVWVVWILVIPNLAPVLAGVCKPVTPLEIIEAQKKSIDREIRIRRWRLTETSGELSYGTKIKDAREKLDRERERRKDAWDKFWMNQCNAQTSMAEVLGRLSPSGCWMYASVGLMDTGRVSYEEFDLARRRLKDDMKAYGDELRKTGQASGKPAEIIPEKIPTLRVRRPATNKAVAGTLPDVLILSILNVLFFLSAFLFFLRYDVR